MVHTLEYVYISCLRGKVIAPFPLDTLQEDTLFLWYKNESSVVSIVSTAILEKPLLCDPQGVAGV